MSWPTVIWSMVAAACLTMALPHLIIGIRQRGARVHLFFAMAAFAVAWMAAAELSVMRAVTTQESGRAVQIAQVPTFIVVVAIVGFVQLYFGTGRLWLGVLACALRAVCLVANFADPPNMNFREITALRTYQFLGETVTMPLGPRNPWLLPAYTSSLLVLAFVIDASRKLWRQATPEHRRRAVVVGGGIVVFVVVAQGMAVLINAGAINFPYSISIPFMAIVAAMGFELSYDVVRAAELSRALRGSEERMSLAAESARLSMWEWDIARDEIWITNPGRALFGFEPGERLNFARFAATLHPDDRESVRSAVETAFASSGDYDGEYRVISGKGPLRWIAARAQVERDEDGKPLRMRGVSIDITERKHAEEALRESEARFRAVANTAPVMIWMAGTDKLCTFFNKGWLDFTGRRLEQELGNGWAEGVHPDDFERCVKTYTTSFDARREFTMEYRLRDRDGEFGWVLDTGVPRIAADGEFLGYIGSCIDISTQKQAEERFRLVVEASPNAMVMVNSEGGITLINAQAEAVFGYTAAELIGQSIEMLVPERFHAHHPGDRRGYFTTPATRAMGAGRELFGRRKDGSEVPVEIGLNPIRTPEGMFVLASIVDITERKRAETEAQQHREEVAHLARVAMLGELSGLLAHELNQPLTAVLSNAQAAQRYLEKDPPNLGEVRDILADIAAQGERAGEIIRRLRLLLKKGEVRQQTLDANEVVLEVLKLVRSDLRNQRVTVETALGPDLWPLQGDRVQLQQVLLNLVMNACDAMAENEPKDRRLTVRTCSDGNGGLRIEVSDVGRGLPTGGAERAFERFFTTKPHGLGLGLSVCRTIITAHGGTLGAENNAGRGATFHYTLPLAKEPTA